MAPVLVTGAAGFIGAHVSRTLLGCGLPVIGLDNFDPFYDRDVKHEVIAALEDQGGFVFFEGDVRDDRVLASALDGVETVVHLAARAGVRESLVDPRPYASVNIDGTVSVLRACHRAGIRRLVFASSSSVYGDGTAAPSPEEGPCDRPASPYAATKRLGELWCRRFVRTAGFRVAVLRLFTVYGPGQRPDLAIHRFTRLLAAQRPIPQFGDGTTERDYTHVDDVVAGVLAAIEWTRDERPAFEVFNLGDSNPVRLDRVIRLIGKAVGVGPRTEIHPRVAGDVSRTWADITKARRVLGFQPRVPVEIGIPQFVRWYEEVDGRQS